MLSPATVVRTRSRVVSRDFGAGRERVSWARSGIDGGYNMIRPGTRLQAREQDLANTRGARARRDERECRGRCRRCTHWAVQAVHTTGRCRRYTQLGEAGGAGECRSASEPLPLVVAGMSARINFATFSCVYTPAGCVSCEPVCVCVSLVRAVIICPASTHTARWCPVRAWLFFTFLPNLTPTITESRLI